VLQCCCLKSVLRGALTDYIYWCNKLQLLQVTSGSTLKLTLTSSWPAWRGR
jgi:hypothetical protein